LHTVYINHKYKPSRFSFNNYIYSYTTSDQSATFLVNYIGGTLLRLSHSVDVKLPFPNLL